MSPLLEKALEAIHNRTNVSTGLAHPNDMNAAKEMFKRLHESGEVLNAGEISSWAVRRGWKMKHAEQLGTLAYKIGVGKRVRISNGPWWKENILEILKQRTTQNL